MAETLKLTEQGDSRRRSGDLWLNRGDVDESSSKPGNGAVVDLLTEDGDFRGRGFYSSETGTAFRLISESKVDVDDEFFRDRLERAFTRRKEVLGTVRSYRLVHSDADFLPGLVVDRYGDVLVTQFRHPTLEAHRREVVDALEQVVEPKSIYARNDVAVRERHDLERYKGLVRGEPVPDTVTVQRSPFRILADVKSGQKTGYYLDQRENRRAFERFAGGEGLDCFSYTGGWGLHALNAGAEHVTFVDQSEDALSLLREILRRNDWLDRAELVEDDAFDVLNRMSRENESFDFIALDPPAFARSRSQLDQARRGYKEANLRAMRMLKDRGILATSSCSAPVSRDGFVRIVRESASDAHTACRVLEERNQPPDHPWLPDLPSTLYLKCLICEISLR